MEMMQIWNLSTFIEIIFYRGQSASLSFKELFLIMQIYAKIFMTWFD